MNFDTFYIKCKQDIEKSLRKNKISRALKMIRFCATAKYYLNDIFYDPDLEKYLRDLAKSINLPKETFSSNSNVVVFYDQVSLYDRVLSKVYLESLLRIKDIRLIYVCHQTSGRNDGLIKMCQEHSIDYYVFSKKYTFSNVIELLNIVKDNGAGKIISQNHVDDFVGVISNYYLDGICERFLINITDHAFWLGQGAYDRIIEFRNFGASLTVNKRNISPTKLVKLPYYSSATEPSARSLPLICSGKKIVLSGGSIYKTQGDQTETFFNVVKHILDAHPDVVFYYLGNGAYNTVCRYLCDPKYSGRFVVEPERKDLDYVMKNCTIYLNTYPLIGGLMTLFALRNNLIPYTLVNSESPANDIDDFLIDCEYKFFFENKNDLINEIDHVLEDDDYLNRAKTLIDGKFINHDLFVQNLESILHSTQTIFPIVLKEIDYDKQTNMYKKNYFVNMSRCLIASRSYHLMIKHPLITIRGLINKFFSK